jgi:cytoskeleton protein RodZ
MTAENEPNKENNPADSDAAQESQQQPVQGPGDILRQAREAKGLSQREVADELRLRKQIIELLEADDYETFSTPTFIKGYLRAYAKLLDVDEKMLFEAYKAKGYQEVQSTQMQSFSRRKKHQESDNRLMLITYAVIIIVVGLVIWWWQDSGMSSEEPAQSSTVDSQVEETGDVGAIEISSEPRQPDIEPNTEEAILESEVSSSDTNISTNELGSENNTEAAPEPSEPEVEAQTETNTDAADTRTEQPAEEGTNVDPQTESAVADEEEASTAQDEPVVEEAVASRLIFEFNQECWVKVDDAEGETQAVGVKAAGYTMAVPGEPPFSITMCKPEAATITFDGEDVDMSQFRRERVARFTVPMSE